MSNFLLQTLPQFRLDLGKLKVSRDTAEIPSESADASSPEELTRKKKKKKLASTSNSASLKDPLMSSEKTTFDSKAEDPPVIALEGPASTALNSSAPNLDPKFPKSTPASSSKKRHAPPDMMPPPQAKRVEKSLLVRESEKAQIDNTPPTSDSGASPAELSAQEMPSSRHPFTFAYDGEVPFLNNRRECARLLDVLKGADMKSHLSDAERLAYSEEAAFYLLKAATFYNYLAADGERKGVCSDPGHGRWEEERKAMLAEVAKTKAELAKAKDEAIAAASRVRAESLKVKEAEAKMKDLRDRLSERSSAAIPLPAIKMNHPSHLSEGRESSEGRASRLNAVSECKGKLDRIRDFIGEMKTHNLLTQSFNQAKAKCDLITLLERDGVAIPSLIKGELSYQVQHAQDRLKSHPAPILHPSELEPPSLYPCKRDPTQVLRPGSSRSSLPPIPSSDNVTMIVPSGLNEHGSNDRMFS